MGFVAEIGRSKKKKLWLFGLAQWVSRLRASTLVLAVAREIVVLRRANK